MLATLAFSAQLLLSAAPSTLGPPPQTGRAAPQSLSPITLGAAIAQARAVSPMRRSAAVQLDGVAATARMAGRPLNPLVEFRTENLSLSGSSGPALDVFGVLVQPLELGGKRAARRALANVDVDVAAAGLHATEREITGEIVRLYVDALRARGRLEALETNRTGLETLVEATRLRVLEGYAPESDLLKFRTEAALVATEQVRAQLMLDQALSGLSVVLGAAVPVAAAQIVEPPRPALPMAGDVAAAVRRTPLVAAADARVARAHQAFLLERARRIPDAALTAGYKRTGGYDTGVAGLAFSIPLFDANGMARARAAGDEQAARADRDALVLRMSANAAAILRAAEALAARAAAIDAQLLQPAEAVRNSARAAFREGSADVLRLIDAERVYRDVTLAALDVRLDALGAAIDARLAVGEEAIP